MLRRAAVLIAFTACQPETPLGREIHLPAPDPVPARVVLGECARPTDTFVVGMAPPKPMYWVELAPPIEGGFGTFGTIGHGYGISGGMRGGWSSGPTIQIRQVQITGADADKWKAITRRYVKRSATKLSYCYEKELLRNRELAGSVVAHLAVAKSGKVTATIGQTFDPRVGACMKGVFDEIELPKPDAPFTATVPVDFGGTSYVDPAVEARNATAVGAPNPLAQRLSELEVCARSGNARGLVELTFDSKGTSASVLGMPAAEAATECVKKVAATTTKTSEAPVMRCAFAIGSSGLDELPTAMMDADGRLTLHGQSVESLFTANFMKDATTVAGLENKGPVGLEVHSDVVMEKVYPVLEDLHSRGAAYVFVVPHAFGGKRLLGRTLPMLPHPKDKTLASDALHVIRVDRGGLFLDDEPVLSLAQFSADLARLRRDDGPAVQIRFERETTFGQFARAVDLAVEAGLTDWEL